MEQAHDLAVGPLASTLQCPPRRQKAGQSFDEGVDGVSRRHCLLGDRQRLTTAIVGRGLEVEHGRVVPAVDPPPPDGEGEGAGQGRREVVVVVVLEDRVQSVALEKELLSPDAVAGHAGVVPVIDDRPRQKSGPMAEQPQPPAEVHVLEEHEVALVEAAQGPEDVGAHEHGRARGEQHVLLDVVVAGVPFLRMKLEAVPVEGESGIDEVDGGALPVQDLGGHARDGAVRLHPRDGGPDPGRIGPGVVVEEGHVLAPRRVGASVAPAGEAEVLGRRHHLDVGETTAQQVDAAVARRVVDDDQLELVARPVQGAAGFETRSRVRGALVVDDDHRHERPALARHQHLLRKFEP